MAPAAPPGARPVYLLAGAEAYDRDRFRRALLATLPPADLEFAVSDEDLTQTPLPAVLDRARTPSLMTPRQVVFLRGVKELFSRSNKKHGDFPDNLRAFAQSGASPPATVLVFVADHIEIPAERNRMALEDKSRLQRLEEVFGPLGEIVYCARATPARAASVAAALAAERGCRLPPPAAQRLGECVAGDLGRLEREMDKLCAYAAPGGEIDLATVAALSGGAATASAFQLARELARRNRTGALASLRAVWRAEGDATAIGLVFQLSRAFKMALVARQAGISDVRGLYGALPEGMRPPTFAAETVITIARSTTESWFWEAIVQLQEVDMALRSNPLSVILLFERLVLELTELPTARPKAPRNY